MVFGFRCGLRLYEFSHSSSGWRVWGLEVTVWSLGLRGVFQAVVVAVPFEASQDHNSLKSKNRQDPPTRNHKDYRCPIATKQLISTRSDDASEVTCRIARCGSIAALLKSISKAFNTQSPKAPKSEIKCPKGQTNTAPKPNRLKLQSPRSATP